MSAGAQSTFRGLVERHGAVFVPLIQRDYAQGRANEQDIRDEFLDSLAGALTLPAGDPTLPLNLDFIYGNVEGDDPSAFQPLDGQQRLTTLFLLHWYCAWQDAAWQTFDTVFCYPQGKGNSRFGYQVRSSSNEFFNELVRFRPITLPPQVESLSGVIVDQPWYFRSWKLDPTVQSTLVMLDALHGRFKSHKGLFERLMDPKSPAITFQLLDLDNFGLSDDLYIKMNARGKPLTAFENFKARYEHELAAKFPTLQFTLGSQKFAAGDYVSRRLDTAWADLFWAMREPKSDSYDSSLMNVIRAIALISRAPDSARYLDDVDALRVSQPTYSDFHAKGWLDELFTLTLVRLFDVWSSDGGRLRTVMQVKTHFDERATFERLAKWSMNPSYTDMVQLSAYASLVTARSGEVSAEECERWMRVVGNLSINTGYNRVEDFRRSIVELKTLIQHASKIEAYLSSGAEVAGFNEQQVGEERVKASLVQAEAGWRPILSRAEAHPYFRGQVEFLLAFSGVLEAAQTRHPGKWDATAHTQLQARFLHHWNLAAQMFGPNGLKALPTARWERALLTLGDYLIAHGSRNLTFITNPVTEPGSWKRYLRGGSSEYAKKRDLLGQLWDRLDPAQPLEAQLDSVIAKAGSMDSWRAALVQWPEMIAYCEDRRVRVEAGCFYLLKRTQRNGAHRELTSYAAYLRNRSRVAELPFLEFAYVQSMDSSEPYLSIFLRRGAALVVLMSYHWANNHHVRVIAFEEVKALHGFVDELVALGFDAVSGRAIVAPPAFDDWLIYLNASGALPPT